MTIRWKVALVEDDRRLARAVSAGLGQEGYTTSGFHCRTSCRPRSAESTERTATASRSRSLSALAEQSPGPRLAIDRVQATHPPEHLGAIASALHGHGRHDQRAGEL